MLIEKTIATRIDISVHPHHGMSLIDTQQVRPWMLEHPVHWMDGRLATCHDMSLNIRVAINLLVSSN